MPRLDKMMIAIERQFLRNISGIRFSFSEYRVSREAFAYLLPRASRDPPPAPV